MPKPRTSASRGPDISPRDFADARRRKANNARILRDGAVMARNKYLQGPPDLRGPSFPSVTYSSPKLRDDIRGPTSRMGRGDYGGVTLDEKGNVLGNVPRVPSKRKYGAPLDKAGKLGNVVEQGARRGAKLGFGTALRVADIAENIIGLLKPPTDTKTGLPQYPHDPSQANYYLRQNGPHNNEAATYPIRGDNIYVAANDWHEYIGLQSMTPKGLARDTEPGHTGNWVSSFGFWRWNTVQTRYGNYMRFFQAPMLLGTWAGHHADNTEPRSITWGNAKDVKSASPSANPNATRSSPSPQSTDLTQKAKSKAQDIADRLHFAPNTFWDATEFIVPLTKTDSPPYVPPIPPHARVIPRPGTRERKVISTGAQIGIDLSKALDRISEGAEVVSAIYDALPEKIRKDWEKKHKPKNRGLTDQAGQYGIDGADWKARAIWKYADQIDVPQAIRNIIANEIEDRLYGKAYKAKDNLTGRGKNRRNAADRFK
jgi:hypothetical protein